MKLRDMMFLVIGGLLVISGMVLNSLLSGDAEAQEGLKDAEFGSVTCRKLIIKDGDEIRGVFGLDRSDLASLSIFDKGDGSHHRLAYLGVEEVYDGKVERGNTRLDLFAEYNPSPRWPSLYPIDAAMIKLDKTRSEVYEMIEKGHLVTKKDVREEGEPIMVIIYDTRDNRKLSLSVNFSGGRIDGIDRTGDGGYRLAVGDEGQAQLYLLGQCRGVKTDGIWIEDKDKHGYTRY